MDFVRRKLDRWPIKMVPSHANQGKVKQWHCGATAGERLR